MAYKVALNGSNHVSEARVRAFEQSLAKGVGESRSGRPHVQAEAPQASPQQAVAVDAKPLPPDRPVPSAHPPVDYPRVLDSLERGLAQSYGHQSETLRVHHQYLSNEAAYAQLFARLMEEQGTLFGDGATSPERSEVVLDVLQTLARSVEQFHTHQTETLSVHNQFLAQQATYAQSFVTLLQEHYGAVLHGNGHGNGNGNGNGHDHHPVGGNGNGAMEARQHSARGMMTEVATQRPPHATPAPPRMVETPVVATTTPTTGGGEALSDSLLAVVSDKTGYPVEMLDLDMDMEADLGIDSIKRVEILGALQDAHPNLPEIETDALAELRTLAQILAYTARSEQHAQSEAPADPVATAVVPEAPTPGETSASVDGSLLRRDLLAIVSDKTGYPVEMLDLDMDMEADLGIDSIKRVEILGALQDQHPGLPEVESDTLAELRTLAQILGYMDQAATELLPEGSPKKA